MNESHYFEALSSAYSSEIEDLTSDSEGKRVLTTRLKEKRQEIDTMLQMIESAPEMVAPMFYDAFSFLSPAAFAQLIAAEPDDADFPEWGALSSALRVADWAVPMVRRVLAEPAGDRFMVSAAALEFLRLKEAAMPDRGATPTDENKPANDEDGDDRDLDEAGADWLSEQGFDARTS